MKITIIGSYNLADGYLGGAIALEKIGYDISFIPATRYRNENTYTEHVNKIISDLKLLNPDIVLWWSGETVLPSDVICVKESVKKPFLMFTWDVFGMHNNISKDSYDIVFACSKDSVERFSKFNVKSVYNLPGFDPNVHFPEYDEKYISDVSLVCTNLYSTGFDQYKHIYRKELIDNIITNAPEIDFKLYGSESFKTIYPE